MALDRHYTYDTGSITDSDTKTINRTDVVTSLHYSAWYDVQGCKKVGIFYNVSASNLNNTGIHDLTIQHAPDNKVAATISDYHCLDLKPYMYSPGQGTQTDFTTVSFALTGNAAYAQYRVADISGGFIRFKRILTGTAPSISFSIQVHATE